jgi:dipeptidase
VQDRYSISNGLTIGEAFEEGHPDLIPIARKKGWLKKGVTFHFARCYSDWLYTTFSASRKRRSRSLELLAQHTGATGPDLALKILRDHGPETSYQPGGHLLQDRLCSHAGNGLTRASAQTTASLAAHLKPKQQTYWVTGTSAPCTGVFKPVWMDDPCLPDIGPAPGALYDARCLWWLHENLHRLVIEDYEHRISMYKQQRDALERRFQEQAAGAGPGDRWEVSKAAFEDARLATMEWIKNMGASDVEQREKRVFRRYWQKQNRAVL